MKPSLFRLVGVILLASQLLGCVGGGGDGTVPIGGTGTGSTGGTSSTGVPKLALTLADKTTAAAVTAISASAPAVATARLTDALGTPVSGALVTFTIGNSALATLSPASGTVLSDASGIAKIQINAANTSEGGATSVTVASSVPKSATDTTPVPVSTSANFSVSAVPSVAAAAPKMVVTLADKGTAAAVTSISPTAPAIATAKLTDATGAPVSGAIVTFTVGNSALATLTPNSGTVLSDANGLARMQVNAASISGAGATSVTAASTTAKSATDATPVAFSGSANFSVGAAVMGLSNLNNGLAGGSTLSPYSTTSISATVTGVPTTTAVPVSFSSVCSNTGKASLPGTVNTINGVATATYTDNACASQDTITVGIVGTNVTQNIALTVNQPAVASIQFVSSTPKIIGILGVGNPDLPTSSIVSFKVVDSSNHPVASVLVSFDLPTRAGGILLNNGASGTVSQLTDASGIASVQIRAGTVPTPVSVTASATVGGQTFTSKSDQLTITTGRAVQDRTSLATATHNIEGWDFFGTSTDLSISLADRMGNPVPDGTPVNFVADGATIIAQCATASGACKVKFTSANPQGRGKTEPAGIVTAGRIRVVAYATGEESFTDGNDNHVYDQGELFNDLGDVFMDSNENGRYDAGEFTVVSGNSAACSSPITTSPYAPSRVSTCDGKWGTSYVRQDATIILSGSVAYIGTTRPDGTTLPATTATSPTVMGGQCDVTRTFWAYDVNKNPLPAKTSIAFGTTQLGIATQEVFPATVPDSVTPGGTPHLIHFTMPVDATTGACKALTVPASFNLKFTTPLGQVSTALFTVSP